MKESVDVPRAHKGVYHWEGVGGGGGGGGGGGSDIALDLTTKAILF